MARTVGTAGTVMRRPRRRRMERSFLAVGSLAGAFVAAGIAVAAYRSGIGTAVVGVLAGLAAVAIVVAVVAWRRRGLPSVPSRRVWPKGLSREERRIRRRLRERQWENTCVALDGMVCERRGHHLTGKPVIDAHVLDVVGVARVPRGLRIDIVPLPGWTEDDLVRWSARLSALWAVPIVCAIPEPGIVEATLVLRDPIAEPRDYPVDQAARAQTGTALIGVTETGDPCLLPLIGSHTLILGATGSGKGSVLGSVVVGLTPQIQAGCMKLWGIDLKGGVEQTAYGQCFERRATEYGEAVDLLADLNAELQRRLAWMVERRIRRLDPTEAMPGLVLMLDEAGALISLAGTSREDKTAAAEADRLMRQILTQGRAAGIAVIAAIQDPRKDALRSRDLFPSQVLLRLNEADAAVVLSAEERAAGLDLPALKTGQAYVEVEAEGRDGRTLKSRERARIFWVSDDVLMALPAAQVRSKA